jgi:hypothetical protein
VMRFPNQDNESRQVSVKADWAAFCVCYERT